MLRSLLLTLTRISVLLSLLCIPLWLRLPAYPPVLTSYYVVRFVMFLPMLAAILFWLASGCPGLRAFAADRWRVGWAIALLLLAGWASLSQHWAFMERTQPDIAENAALRFMIVALFTLIAACSGITPRTAAAALAISGVWNAALGILQVNANGAIGLTMLGEFPYSSAGYGTSIVRAGDLVLARPYGLHPHPNIFAGVLMIGGLAASAWLVSARRWLGIVGACAVAFILYGLLVTFSRAAWGGFFVGGLTLLLFARLVLRRAALPAVALCAVLCLVAGGLFIAEYGPFIAARAGDGQESTELRSVSDRLVFTDFAFRAIREEPLTGIGAGNFPWRASRYLRDTFYDLRGDNVHNVYLLAWAELGTPGLALLLAALACLTFAAVRAIRRERTAWRIALLAGGLALSAVGLLDHYPYSLLQTQTAWWVCFALAGTSIQGVIRA